MSKDNYAICVLHPNKDKINGVIKFSQKKDKKTKVEYCVSGLKDGLHGFHVHEYGDLTDGCKSTCSHFNPNNKCHGGRNSLKKDMLGTLEILNQLIKSA